MQLWNLCLKKHNLDSLVLANFRPISKLPFLSKILEKVVFTQLYSFLNLHCLHEVFQSGFKSLHSTETALLNVFNDLLLATDSGDYAVLMLLDLMGGWGDRAFLVVGPRLWNNLPLHVRNAQTLSILKSSLKTYFYSMAFNMA